MWRYVRFYNGNGKVLDRRVLRRGQAESVVVRIPYSKSDPFGRGRVNAHVRQSTVDKGSCIVRELEEWAIQQHLLVTESGGSGDVYVFELGNSPLVSCRHLVWIMRLVARHLGISDKAISLHSLRYGGATLLASVGLPQYVIEHYGGWSPNSSSLRTYVQLGHQSTRQVSDAMSRASQSGLAEMRVRSRYFGCQR
jgi:hypothetical protein